MRYMKRFAQVALAAAAVTAFVGAGAASATTLEIEGVTQNQAVSLTISLKAGTSVVLRDTFGFFVSTCTQSHVERATESPFTGSKVTGANETLTFGGCEPLSVTVHKPGKLYVEHIAGTTNGRVYSEEAEVTVWVEELGTYINCTTGAGTLIGTTTGTKEGHTTLDINAALNCGEHLSSGKWTGSYTITSPTGLGISA